MCSPMDFLSEMTYHCSISVHDIVIMQRRSSEHNEICREHGYELTYDDAWLLYNKYPNIGLRLKTRVSTEFWNFCTV